ncbi:NAD(P)-binding protein [Periconia macrospinosa]|uniref:NAD(P)-binding protein n=1 Tax=Periconia macrospinosa TaxID=97972 RepID=A0A2V1EC03_9PLEO|nr:NAD(P)-binding protein [Periconia macrospinosa]
MAEATTVTLITGPNRGIGHGILATILARPNNTVIAAVRDPRSDVSKALNELPKGEGSSLILTNIDQSVPTDAAEAVQSLDSLGVSRIDTVVANAAIADSAAMVAATSLMMFADTWTSSLGSATLVEYMKGPWFCYGVTKTAVNYMVRRIHVENDWLTAIALQPGWVQTDMGNLAAKTIGMEAAPMKLEDSVAGCVKVIDAASREKYAGQWVDSEEKLVPW